MTKTTKNKIVYEENINNIKGKALAIVFPENLQEIKNLVKLSDHDIIARGSGTSFSGAVIPKNSVIVDFSKMNEIIEINPSKKTAIVQPGVLLAELNEELEPYELEFPIEPLFSGIETIGGIIAKNSSGNREIRYNRAINWVDSLEIINAKGEQQKISKSDLSDFVGMEGITGIIVKATLRLTNKKTRTMTILKANALEDIFAASKRMRFDQEVSSIDLLNKQISSLLGLENRYHLFIEYESDKGSFKGDDYERFVKLKNRAYKRIALEGYCILENMKFLFDSLQDFIIYLEERRIPYFCHMASGIIYPLFKNDEKEKIIHVDAMKFAQRLRAKIGYNLGVGLINRDFLEVGEADLIKRIKNRLDRDNKFNQDKVISAKFAEAPPRKREQVERKIEESVKQTEYPLEEIKKEELMENESKEKQQEQSVQDLIDEQKEKPLEEPIIEEQEKTEEEKQKDEKKGNEEQQVKQEIKIDVPAEIPKVVTVGDLIKSGELKLPEENNKENKQEDTKKQEISPEEKEKIRKIASGFFAGGRDTKEEKNK